MWAQLTYDGVSKTYGLPVKGVIGAAQAVTDGAGVQHGSAIFTRWTPAELLATGWPPFREVAFDQATLRSTGFTDEVAGDEVVRTHTTQLAGLDRLKDRRRGEILTKRQAVMDDGLTFAASHFDTDPATVATINLIATALTDGETLPAGFTWRDRDGVGWRSPTPTSRASATRWRGNSRSPIRTPPTTWRRWRRSPAARR